MGNIIRDRHDILVRTFEIALEQCAKALDEGIANGDFKADEAPKWEGFMTFGFPQAKMEISVYPVAYLANPDPLDPVVGVRPT